MSRIRTTWVSFKADSDSQIVQSFPITEANIHGSPVFWNSPAGPQIYLMGEVDHLKAFRLVGTLFQTTPANRSRTPSRRPECRAGFASLSANGSLPGTGVVWVSHPYDQNANWVTVPGILRAYDASDLSHELWNSYMKVDRDDGGMFAKFCAPTVANGKVYLSTFANQLQVYGLLDGILPAIDSVSATAQPPGRPFPKARRGGFGHKRRQLQIGQRCALVLRASLDTDGKTVFLATTPLKSGVQYTLSPAGIHDRDNPKLTLLPATHTWVRSGSPTADR